MGSKNDTFDEAEYTELLSQLLENRQLPPRTILYLVIAYGVLIVTGAIENLFIVTIVIKKTYMRNARNIFILNLAISDLLLCLLTAPMTLLEIISRHWALPKWQVLCKSAGILQGTSVYVSTLTIMAIALDRCQVIVYPTNRSLHVKGTVVVLIIIWAIALILISPIYIYKDFDIYTFNLTELPEILLCIEKWPMAYGRAYYSAFGLIVQYLLPVIVISTAYTRICKKLKGRMNLSKSNYERERNWKTRKTNYILIAIALVYGISWLPLNLLNLITDIDEQLIPDKHTFLIIFAVCHLMGMSSACSNPLLYGWLNENFKKEFKEMFRCCRKPTEEKTTCNMSTDVLKEVRYDCNDKRVITEFTAASVNTELFDSDNSEGR